MKNEKSVRTELITLGASILAFAAAFAFRGSLSRTPYRLAEYGAFLVPYLASGWPVLARALRNIARGRVFDENFLMTVATIGAFAIGELPEAAAVMIFFQLGELLEGLSVRRSRRSVRSLLEFRPDSATLLAAEGQRTVAPADVRIGDAILVRPGEKIPLDGKVLSGRSAVDTSALTGEHVPRSVEEGGEVLAGFINGQGTLTVRVAREFQDSSAARILHLVENAMQNKAQTERFISRFARSYTPFVVIVAALIAFVPPLLLPGAHLADWIHRALVVLVVSCPCALVISIPLGYFGGIGGASHNGILLKGSQHLDTLAGIGTVVFDKTGTLTEGAFEVRNVEPLDGIGKAELLALAARAETNSTHPIAESIRRAAGSGSGGGTVDGTPGASTEIPGQGILATIDGAAVVAGNDRLLHRQGIAHPSCDARGTVVHVARDGRYLGRITIGDRVRADAGAAVRSLKEMGIERVLMLTGDSAEAAKGIHEELGLDGFRAELLPEEKVAEIERIIASSPGGGKVLFVGDGMNDAPVIARADLGAAMGGLASDAAIETADMVITTDSLAKIPLAIHIGRKTRSIVRQNIGAALAIKAAFILLGAIGVASMWEAVFADMGVALLAILNAARSFRVREGASHPRKRRAILADTRNWKRGEP
ncbi:MAG: heavy metal translocating P-type ATPase [Spirochaetes bacterium]|nr:heavy metal translocating P-type ATPase [Spirochaetota bacterium]